MSITRSALSNTVAALALAVAAAQSGGVRAATSAAPDAALVQQGRYLALAADCMSCHSAPGAAPFSGGAALHTAFGDIWGPNITPDPRTGIGRWSEADFTRALREGIRKDGAPLYPAMPYDSYSLISDADAHALWAYLRTVPPVRHAAPTNTLRFPMNLRRGVTLWQSVYFKPGRFVADPAKSEVWNRGAYLVDALGHCGACHTPRNFAQASESGHRLGGGRIENWFAPDIGSDAWSKLAPLGVEDLQRYLKTGRMPGNAQAFGPMQEVVHDSLSHLDDGDLHAMAVYLKEQPASGASAAASAPAPGAQAAAATPGADHLKAGEQLYTQHCATCHQPQGQGAAGQIPALAGNSAVTAGEAYNVVTAVLQGFDAHGHWAAMPSFASQLDDAQIADLANYVRNSWGNRSPRPATPELVAALRSGAETPARGERAALLCPVLPAGVMQPAWQAGAQALLQSAHDTAQLQQLVAAYRAARPRASAATVVEALSAAYCRALTGAGAGAVRTEAGMIDYAQQVAGVAGGAEHRPAPTPAPPRT